MPEFRARFLPSAGLATNAFVLGYLECAEFTFSDTVDDVDIDAPPDDCEGWHPEALAQAISDCAAFMAENLANLGQYVELMGCDAAEGARRAGRDFYYTRCGHGTGFWDRERDVDDVERRPEMREIGDALSAACREFGDASAYLGDDKFLYFS